MNGGLKHVGKLFLELSEIVVFDPYWWTSTFGGRKKRLVVLLVQWNVEVAHILINGRDLKLRSTVRTDVEMEAV